MREVSSGALAALETLNLGGNAIGDDGMSALAKAIKPTAENASGALASLENLKLYGNAIGDEGMSALAKAITPDKDGRGALAPGATVSLGGNSAMIDFRTAQ